MPQSSGTMAHDHPHPPETISDRGLLWTVIINLGLSIFEFSAGILSGSVALMADALHNTNDAAALLIAYIARKIAKKDADAAFTFGYRRAELIGAMIQLTALIVVGLYLVVEAVRRVFVPEPLEGTWMMLAAGVALAVDLVTAWLLWAMSRGSLNVKAAFLHNLTDAGASVAVILGGAAVHWLGWLWVDPVLTLLIAGSILHLSVHLLKRTSAILMEGTPEGVQVQDVKRAVEAIDGVIDLHHIHIWELDENRRALEGHLVISEARSMAEMETLKAQVKQLLRERFAIAHSTLEVESEGGTCAAC